MAAGDVKTEYGTSTDLAVTTLVDLASSATWVIGWSSAAIDNTSNKYLDYLISGALTILHDGSPTAGEIRVYIVPMISDTVWPDAINADETSDTWSLANARDAIAKMGASLVTTATVHLTYPFAFSVAALFGGVCPPKFCIFITHNTTTTLDHDGQTVTYQGIYNTVAAA
jgi:hypothetical protein